MKSKIFITFGVFIICFLITTGNIYAQYATDVTITDIGNTTLTMKMEQEASKLLTAFNDAYMKDQQPSIRYVKDQESVSALWAISPLKCIETEIIERGYTTSSGYQLRNIPMFLKGVPEEDAERDIAINFDKNGNITDIHFTISVGGFLSEAKEVTDLRRRLVLIDFVENFRTAYNRKDINNISNKFSDDAQIITGRIMKVSKGDGALSFEKIEYKSQTKKEYIDGLRRTFANNKVIDVKFGEIELQQHPKYDHIYGVNLTQEWNSTNYSDYGYVFLYIDFRDENNPLIKVRSWQPDKFQGRKPSFDDFM